MEATMNKHENAVLQFGKFLEARKHQSERQQLARAVVTVAIFCALFLLAVLYSYGCGGDPDLVSATRPAPQMQVRVVAFATGHTTALWHATLVLDPEDSAAIYDDTAHLLEAGYVIQTPTAVDFAVWSEPTP
jgi:hypothetical protein